MYPPIFLSDPGLPLLPDSLTHRPWLSATDRAATGLEEEGGRRAQSCSTSCCMRHATDWPAASWGWGVDGVGGEDVQCCFCRPLQCSLLSRTGQMLLTANTERVNHVHFMQGSCYLSGFSRVWAVRAGTSHSEWGANFWGADGEQSDGASELGRATQSHCRGFKSFNVISLILLKT